MSLFDDVLAFFHHSSPAAPPPAPHVAAAIANPPPPVEAPDHELEMVDSVIQEIEVDEGDVLKAYPDAGGVWTIGYGHTGPDVYEGLVITQAQAQALLEQDLAKFEDGVGADVDGYETNNNQYSAMVSLAFNIGLGSDDVDRPGGFERSSVLRFHRAGQYQQAADAFLLWNKSAGKVLPGLVRRRHEERAVYLTAVS